MDDFTLGVLFVAKRDDRGLATARVRTELWVDVSLDDFGEGLGLFILIIIIIRTSLRPACPVPAQKEDGLSRQTVGPLSF